MHQGLRAAPVSHRRRSSDPSAALRPRACRADRDTHLRIIDGTGAAPIEDATLLIDGAKIGAVLPAGRAVGGLPGARRNR